MADRRARGLAAPGERDEVFGFLPDLNAPTRYLRIAELLAARGHSEARIEKILGGNFARLFTAVWGEHA
jgi:membrane dipeptidase